MGQTAARALAARRDDPTEKIPVATEKVEAKPCVFRWNENGAGPDRYRNRQRYRYRAPLCVDPAGARQLAAFLVRHAADEIVLRSEPSSSGTSSLVAFRDLDSDGSETRHVTAIRPLTPSDEFAPSATAATASASIDLWRSDCKSEGAEPPAMAAPSKINMNRESRRTQCVLAHGLTLVFEIASYAVRPSDDRRTHEAHQWTAVVQLSSRPEEVAVHMWPSYATRVLGDRYAASSWEDALHQIDVPPKVQCGAIGAYFSYCAPHLVIARFASNRGAGAVAILDISKTDFAATASASISSPTFSAWHRYAAVDEAHRVHPAAGFELRADDARITPLDWRFAPSNALWQVPFYSSDEMRDDDGGDDDDDGNPVVMGKGVGESVRSSLSARSAIRSAARSDIDLRMDRKRVLVSVGRMPLAAAPSAGGNEITGASAAEAPSPPEAETLTETKNADASASSVMRSPSPHAASLACFEMVSHDHNRAAITVVDAHAVVRTHRVHDVFVPLDHDLPPGTRLAITSLVVLPCSRRIVANAWPQGVDVPPLGVDLPPLPPIPPVPRRFPPSPSPPVSRRFPPHHYGETIQVYDRAFRHEATYALDSKIAHVELLAALPNDDLLIRLGSGARHFGPTLVFRPSDGRCRPAFPAFPGAVAAAHTLVWLPNCAHIAADRRARVAAALLATEMPRVLADLVCAYAAVGGGGGDLD